MAKNDNELAIIRVAQEGNEAAWGELVKRYSGLIWSATSKYSFSYDEREDIAQEVFLRLVKNIKDYDPDKSRFSTFVVIITKHVCIDRLRKIIRNPEVLSPDEEEKTDIVDTRHKDPIDSIFEHELIDLLNKIIDKKLKAEQRLLIKLFYFEGCSYSRISSIMNRNEHWVKNTIDRTRKYLRKELQKLKNIEKY
ncbi:sigma-70 family RNA polymerase sigma factor [Candidatus Micrarchaeota archaeon]|nr:sigma-70 family RNA polymerase sigma factor [Candidatus Micrarchaeota archaeon]